MPRAALSTTGESSTSRRAAFREGFASADRPDSIRTAINDFGEPEYGGPAPPQKHGTHHYHFKLAALDVARAVTRRAERAAVELAGAGHLGNPQVLRYLNRLSSLLFMLARFEDREAGVTPLRAKAPS